VYLCSDSDPVCNAAIAAADLSDGEWRDVIPQLSLQGRNSLQTRPDLGPQASDALASHAPARVELPVLLVSANDDMPESTDTEGDIAGDRVPAAAFDAPTKAAELSQISNLVSK